MLVKLRIFCLLLGIIAPVAAPAAPDTPKPLFAASDPIHLTIRGTIPKTGTDATPTDATLSVVGASAESLPVKLTARGITRRKTEVCQFPPLRIEFVQKPPAGSLFSGQHRLKLVTHCQAAPAYQQYLMLEYSAYRMYNVLTPLSFDVRLATIDYVDANGKPITSKPAFFIEDTDDVAHRNGLREAKVGDRILVAQLSPPDAAREAVFQYLIGNLDWAMNAGPAGTGCCHNTKLLSPEGATANLIAMPYDFDFAGLVNAPYASPPDKVPVPNVRTRRYRGFCRHNAEALTAAADIRARKSELLAVFDANPILDEGSRRKALSYLGGFFDQTPGDAEVTAKLLKTCIG